MAASAHQYGLIYVTSSTLAHTPATLGFPHLSLGLLLKTPSIRIYPAGVHTMTSHSITTEGTWVRRYRIPSCQDSESLRKAQSRITQLAVETLLTIVTRARTALRSKVWPLSCSRSPLIKELWVNRDLLLSRKDCRVRSTMLLLGNIPHSLA